MRSSTTKLIVFVIIPVIILIIIGGFYLLKIKPIRFAVVDYALKYSMNKAVKEGKISRDAASKLQYALRDLVTTADEVKLTEEEERLFSQEVLKLVQPLNMLDEKEKLTDEEVQQIIDAIGEMKLKIIEIVKQREKK